MEIGPSGNDAKQDLIERLDDLLLAFELQAIAEVFKSGDCQVSAPGGDSLQLDAQEVAAFKKVAWFIIHSRHCSLASEIRFEAREVIALEDEHYQQTLQQVFDSGLRPISLLCEDCSRAYWQHMNPPQERSAPQAREHRAAGFPPATKRGGKVEGLNKKESTNA